MSKLPVPVQRLAYLVARLLLNLAENCKGVLSSVDILAEFVASFSAIHCFALCKTLRSLV